MMKKIVFRNKEIEPESIDSPTWDNNWLIKVIPYGSKPYNTSKLSYPGYKKRIGMFIKTSLRGTKIFGFHLNSAHIEIILN